MAIDPSGWHIRTDPAETAARRARGEWRGRTIAEDARRWVDEAPARVAVQEGDGPELTFGDAFAQAASLAGSLWRLGLRPGDVIAFQLPNWREAVAIDLAACLLGLVVNPIVPIYRAAEVGFILQDCRAKAVFIPADHRGFDYAAMIAALRSDLPELAHVVVLRGTGAPDTLAFADLLSGGGAVPWPVQRPDAVKMVMYTSGTTGRPKGVLHTHETMPRSVAQSVAYWSVEDGDVVLMPSPVTHITGYSWGIEAPFYHGVRAVLMERWDAAEAVRLIDRHQATMTVGATPFLEELVRAAERAGSRLPSLKTFACGGAAVPPDLIRRANRLFARGRACRVYGSTEAPMVTLGFVGGDDTLEPAAATDGLIVDYDVVLTDDRGIPVPAGTEGEVLVRGPSLFVGYADQQETALSFTPEGRFRMGDIGILTDGNTIVITGRKKDLIIRGGENISAKEIEDALHRHPGLREVAAVSMPHPRLGETVCAFVIASDAGFAPTLVDLCSHLDGLGLARQKFPEHIELVDDLPRTASGKVKKDILRRIIAEKIALGRA